MTEVTRNTRGWVGRFLLPAVLLAATLGVASPAAATTLTFEMFYTNLPCGPCFDDVGGTVPPVLPAGYGYPEGFGIPGGYGDRVTALEMADLFPPFGGDGFFRYGENGEGFTPNVTASYGPYSIFTGGPSLWRGGYGDLDGVLYQGSRHGVPPIGNDYNVLDIVLVADPGYEVILYDFDLGAAFGDKAIAAIEVFDGVPFPFLTPTNYIGQALNVSVEGDTHTQANFVSLQAPVIWIRINANNLGGDSEFIGIDNIRFGQVESTNTSPRITPEEIDAAFTSSEVPEPAALMLLLVGGAGIVGTRVRQRRRDGSSGAN